MNCPFCGEPIRSRHTFCTVCGSDLKPILDEKPTVISLAKNAGKKMCTALTKPLSKTADDSAASAANVRDAAAQSAVSNDSPAMMPDFMRQYL